MLNSLVERQSGLKVRLLSKKLEAKAITSVELFGIFISLPSLDECDVSLYNHVLWRTKAHKEEFSFLFPKLGGGIKNSTLGKFTYISH